MSFSKLSTEQHISSTDAKGIIFRPILKYDIKTVAVSRALVPSSNIENTDSKGLK